ncbi:MAG: hypothetical protein HY287_05505 [Planctomycetes bacterium]|nr:hypothetical protein [Planctomycetota bacterium]MBI3833767.1 hypothetical protein [Planctomycetota bacterium]
MVTDVKENMNKFFDTMGDGVRAAFDAGQRTHEAFWRTTQDAWKRPADMDRFMNRTTKVMREWAPLMSRNLDTFADACEMNIRKGVDICKNTLEVTTNPDEGDLYAKTRQLWDSAFDVMRSNFEVMAKATARTMQACSNFCDTVGCCEDSMKHSAGNQPQNVQSQRPAKQQTQHVGA